VVCAYCDPDGLGAKDRRLQWARKQGAPELRSYLGLVDPDADADAVGVADDGESDEEP
jgi:hypothetical protein